MKDKTISLKSLLLASMMIMVVSGCGAVTAPSDFYTLKPLTAGQETTPAQGGVKDLVVGIGPVSWPEYLDRPQLITRESPIRVRVNEFHRWAGPPQEDFLRVLTQNISLLLDSDKVFSHPWGDSFGVAYKVPLDVQQFDGNPGEAVLLNVRWAVLGRDDKPLIIRKSVIKTEVNGTDYDSLVLAESQALVELSKEIAPRSASWLPPGSAHPTTIVVGCAPEGMTYGTEDSRTFGVRKEGAYNKQGTQQKKMAQGPAHMGGCHPYAGRHTDLRADPG